MNSINTMLLIDIVIVFVGIYFFFLGIRMKKEKKVDAFVVPEETLRNCKDQEGFARYLSIRQIIFSSIMIVCGILMAVHETILSLGWGYYGVVAVLSAAFISYYMQLTNGRVKFC